MWVITYTAASHRTALASLFRTFPDKPIDSPFGEISHFIFNCSRQACTAPFSQHFPLTFVQFCSLDYRRKEVTGSHLPSLLLLLQKQQFVSKWILHKHNITFCILYMNLLRKVFRNNLNHVMDESAMTQILCEGRSKLFPGRRSCALLWCGVTVSAGILMMWILGGGRAWCCDHDLRYLLFSFLSTRGRTLKVNQRPFVLTQMFGLHVVGAHTARLPRSGLFFKGICQMDVVYFMSCLALNTFLH